MVRSSLVKFGRVEPMAMGQDATPAAAGSKSQSARVRWNGYRSCSLPTKLGAPNIRESACPAFVPESQRDSVRQPRVARTALPWERVPSNDQPQRGCVLLFQSHFNFIFLVRPILPHVSATTHVVRQDTTPLGLGF
jgi:hypothetical protein